MQIYYSVQNIIKTNIYLEISIEKCKKVLDICSLDGVSKICVWDNGK